LGKFLPLGKRLKKRGELKKGDLSKRVCSVLQELGPTYIKFGQLLSTRADILPINYIKELRKLQDHVSSEPFEKMETVLIDEMGENYRQFFKKIDTKPRAAASIAQTYHGVLHNGRDVILKIQRPGIEKIINTDLEIMKNLVLLVEEKEIVPSFFKAHKIVEEFRDSIKKELDFKREAASIKMVCDNFKTEESVIIPELIEELSGKRLLVLEEIKGIKLSEFEPVKHEVDGKELAQLGARVLMKQTLIDGFFHADPHPGNVFIMDNNKLAYIDFGMMGQLTEEDRDKLIILFIAFLKKKIDLIIDTLLEIGDFEGKLNHRKFKLEISDLINRYYGIAISEINYSIVIDDIQRILYNFRIRIPAEFFLLFRAISVNQGVAYTLDPSFNIVETANEFLKEIVMSKLRTDNLLEKMTGKLWRVNKITRNLPGKLNRLFTKFVTDEFTIRFKHQNLGPLIHKLDIVSNRLSISLIISALIIGSSMILQTDLQPMIYGIPLFGFAGYSIAGIMGIWLVLSIFRSGKF
ncbi:MAG TPA: AarF/UbiB family protein, partial [Halanaerobiales bacterium]|nr:AarF/UbiB family protein [Halanaerobiales bacterium]